MIPKVLGKCYNILALSNSMIFQFFKYPSSTEWSCNLGQSKGKTTSIFWQRFWRNREIQWQLSACHTFSESSRSRSKIGHLYDDKDTHGHFPPSLHSCELLENHPSKCGKGLCENQLLSELVWTLSERLKNHIKSGGGGRVGQFLRGQIHRAVWGRKH